MKKMEFREVTVYYCDVCGKEIEGNMTTLKGWADEMHACHGWIEAEETRCDLKLEKEITGRVAAAKSRTRLDSVP